MWLWEAVSKTAPNDRHLQVFTLLCNPLLGKFTSWGLSFFVYKMEIVTIPYFLKLLWRLRKLLYLKCLDQWLVHKCLMGFSYDFCISRVSPRSRFPGSARLDWVSFMPCVTSLSFKLASGCLHPASQYEASLKEQQMARQKVNEWMQKSGLRLIPILPFTTWWFWTAWIFHLSETQFVHIWNGNNNAYFVGCL